MDSGTSSHSKCLRLAFGASLVTLISLLGSLILALVALLATTDWRKCPDEPLECGLFQCCQQTIQGGESSPSTLNMTLPECSDISVNDKLLDDTPSIAHTVKLAQGFAIASMGTAFLGSGVSAVSAYRLRKHKETSACRAILRVLMGSLFSVVFGIVALATFESFWETATATRSFSAPTSLSQESPTLGLTGCRAGVGIALWIGSLACEGFALFVATITLVACCVLSGPFSTTAHHHHHQYPVSSSGSTIVPIPSFSTQAPTLTPNKPKGITVV